MKRTLLHGAALWILLGLLGIPVMALSAAADRKKPIGLADILVWKSVNLMAVSNDGRWLAYRLSPVEGDSEMVVRQIDGDRESRFPVGEVPSATSAPSPGPGPADGLVISEDSRWVAFATYPTRKEAAQLGKDKKPPQNGLGLLNTATGVHTAFSKIKRFAFSGKESLWIALQKYPAAGQDQEKAPDKFNGSDLILRELGTGAELNVGNVSDFVFDKGGRSLAWTIDARDRSGNGIVVRDLGAARVTTLDSGDAVYERPTWNEEGDALVVLKGSDDKRYTDKRYSVLGFVGFGSGTSQKTVYDPAGDPAFPENMTVSASSNPAWTSDRSGLLFGIRALKLKAPQGQEGGGATGKDANAGQEAKEAAPEPEKPDLVIWHWLDRRLQSQQEVEERSDKDFSYLSVYRVKDQKFIRLADQELRTVTPPDRGRWAVGIDTRAYELMGNMDGREYQDVYSVDLQTGARRLAAKKVRWYFGPSTDGARFLYFDDGHFHVYEAETGQTTNITKAVPTSFVNLRDDHNVTRPPVSPVGWAKDGQSVVLSDDWDVWSVPVSGGAATNLTAGGKAAGTRYRRRLRLDPDEKGIDLTAPMYFETYGEWTKKAGLARVDAKSPGAQPLLWDDALFSRVLKAKDADVFLYTRETAEVPPDVVVVDRDFGAGRALTALAAQQDAFRWSDGARLLDYTSTKGDRLQAALYLPAGYEKGKSYPTIVYIYERLAQDLNRYYAPTAYGFNKSVYTSNGYAVLMPDIAYKVNDPGMSAVWCVLPALKAAISTGVVDGSRVGLHGHSWGGYQTAFLVTQTDAFAAAVAGAPLTDMVSMYSLIYKNTGSTNQRIFESSQGRFAGGYWDNWTAYYRNSPVFFAENVKTPLLMMHNDKDGAVDFTQGMEYFNTLRRMGKPVVMLEYLGENHNLRKPVNRRDYTVRMREFFDHHLMGALAPPWLLEGVARLDMEDHLKQRTGREPEVPDPDKR